MILNPGYIFCQDYYGTLGYRENKFNDHLLIMDLAPYFEPYDDWDYLIKAKPSPGTWIFGGGYKKYNNYKNKLYYKDYFVHFERGNVIYISKDNDYLGDDKFYFNNWSVGAGYGIILDNGLTISANAEYNIFTGVESSGDYEILNDLIIPSEDYISINISIGFSKRINDGLGYIAPIGGYYTRNIGKHFINPIFSQINSNQYMIEMPATWAGVGLLIFGIAWASTYDNEPQSSIPTLSTPSGCHVYGKIKYVEFGEDYKVKFVSFGENVRIRYVSFGADSPGEWQIVEFGEDYKIKVVEFGEDFRVREVDFGEGCN
tara:strand:+ start:773 stop:1720 length:948 start_codon:yes stop_codon:yes gene_type:complete